LKRVKYPNKHLLPSRIHDPRVTQKHLAMKIQQVLNKPELRVERKSWGRQFPQYMVRDWLEEAKSSIMDPYLLMVVPFAEQCMTWDERKVKNTPYMFANDKSRSAKVSKYLTLCVGKDKSKRKVWMTAHGFILWIVRGRQSGDLIQHRCNNSRCVNQWHLEPGTHQTNHYRNTNYSWR